MVLRRAAKAAGLDGYGPSGSATTTSATPPPPTSAARATTCPGVMYLLGQKQPATTGRYMRPQKDAASDVLRAAAAANAAQFRSHSGTRTLLASPSPATSEKQNPEPYEMIRGLPAVRGRGLEPRWLLTASTSS